MAAIDTIEVLDGLQFAQAAADADVYTVVAVGIAGECVRTTPVILDPNASAARVLINNGYGATGSTVVARVRLTGTSTISPLAKIQNVQPLEWTSIALASVQESAEIDLSALFMATAHIDVAIVGTTAHLGTEIIVQVRKEATVDEWTEWARFVVLSGLTAVKADVSSTAAAGQKVIATANPVTNFGTPRLTRISSSWMPR